MPLFTGSELRASKEEVEYLMYPLIVKGSLTLVSAPQKSMKTYLGLQLATSLANGKKFVDWQTGKPLKVLYIDYEIGIGEAKKRYLPMFKLYGTKHEDNFIIRTRDEEIISIDPPNHGNGEGRKNFIKLIETVRPDVVFIDTLAMSHSMEENSNDDMKAVLMGLRHLQLEAGFTAVVIHHDGKVNDSGGVTKRRGASVIGDIPETLIEVTKFGNTAKKDDGGIELNCTFRNHAPIEKLRLAFEPVPDDPRTRQPLEWDDDEFIAGMGMFKRHIPKSKPASANSNVTSIDRDKDVDVAENLRPDTAEEDVSLND
jgi:RecA-family ATPase